MPDPQSQYVVNRSTLPVCPAGSGSNCRPVEDDDVDWACADCGRPIDRRRKRGARKGSPERWQPVRPRIERQILKNAVTGCWEWIAHKNKGGYGILHVRGRAMLAHRASFEEFVRKIGPGMEIDHLCRNRACVNPEHLEEVTSQENHLRSPLDVASRHARKTHCPHGHEYTPETTLLQPQSYDKRKFARLCGTCYADRAHRLKTLAQHLAEQEQVA